MRWIASRPKIYTWGDYEKLKHISERALVSYSPKMVVLYGPPGTGKTTWARSLPLHWVTYNKKGEACTDCVYVEVTPGDLASKWAGNPIRVMRYLFRLVEDISIQYADGRVILVFDEADAIFTRPSSVAGDYSLEFSQLLSEVKSRLGTILSKKVNLFIVLTTNFKDAIVRADPAIADRVSEYVYVGEPPFDVRFEVVRDRIDEVVGGKRLDMQIRSFSYDVDFLIGLLSAYGYNVVDVGVLSDSRMVLSLVSLMLVELSRVYDLKYHGVEKSFMRSVNNFGFSEAESFFDAGDRVKEFVGGLRGGSVRDEFLRLLYFSGGHRDIFYYDPLVFALMVSSLPKEVVIEINDLSVFTTFGIRMALAPAVFLTAPINFDRFHSMLDKYNKVVVRELSEGKILEPLRYLYKTGNLNDAVRMAESLPEEFQPFIRIAMITPTLMLPAIREKDSLEKARIILNTVTDTQFESNLWNIIRRLNVEKDIGLIQAIYKRHFLEGCTVTCTTPSFFNSLIIDKFLTKKPKSTLPQQQTTWTSTTAKIIQEARKTYHKP
jgi:hypothetical protein